MNIDQHAELIAANRRAFMDALGSDAALLFASPDHIRNGDAEYRYRQNSDLLYLTGWTEPECVLLLRPGMDEPFILFVQAKDPEKEVWTGIRPGPEGAVERFGADAAFPIADLAARLPDLLQGVTRLHYRFAEDFDRDRLLMGAIAKARRKARDNGLDVPEVFVDPAHVLHALRMVKRPAEIAILERAARITHDAHVQAMQMTRPGVMEYEIEAHIDYVFRKQGGVGPGYATIVGGGANATVLHYVDNHDALKDGDLVCVDAGCEYEHYTADVTRTWPVNGRFSDAQRELYQLVLDAQLAAIDRVRVGQSWRDVHDTATRVLTQGMVRLGLLPAWSADEGADADPSANHPEDQHIDWLIEQKKHKRYYMHGTGHWLGMDVHDVGPYAGGGASQALLPGMVITVEPGLYIMPGDTDAPERFRGMGIRIEDDVLVTDGDPQVLTASIPKTVQDIEALMASQGDLA